MADNCSSLEPWSFRSAFDISDAFALETETLTRALQMSLTADADVLAAFVAGGASPPFLVKPEPSASLSASDAETAPKRIRTPVLSPPAGKISKRKSRASKRSTTTTYITADPANFRQMVQQVTGIRFGAPYDAAETVLKPAPQRAGVVGGGGGGGRVPLQGNCLPTLDTSSFLLDRAWAPAPSAVPSPASNGSSFGSPAPEGAAGFDLDPHFTCFPTLESWGVM